MELSLMKVTSGHLNIITSCVCTCNWSMLFYICEYVIYMLCIYIVRTYIWIYSVIVHFCCVILIHISSFFHSIPHSLYPHSTTACLGLRLSPKQDTALRGLTVEVNRNINVGS